MKRTMAKKNKYSVNASEFHDYFEGKLSNRERNAFERKMQKDLFNTDAAEGYSMVSREEAEEDLNNAGKKIRRRINLRRRVGWYSAAATLAAILTITTVFIAVDQTPNDQGERIRKMSKELDKTVIEDKKTEAQPSSQAAGVTAEEADKQDMSLDKADASDDASETREVSAVLIEEEKIVDDEPQVAGYIEEGAQGIGAGAVDAEIDPDIVEDDMVLEAEEVQAEVHDFAMVMDDEEVSELVVLDEVVIEASMKKEDATTGRAEQVTLSSVEKSSRAAAAKSRTVETEDLGQVAAAPVSVSETKSVFIQKATPEDGMPAYMVYVDSTLVFPEAELSRSSALVELKFYIMPDGRPDNIQIITSPSKAFSDEVRRVIMNGPAWTPASSEGIYNNSELEMRIEFNEGNKR